MVPDPRSEGGFLVATPPCPRLLPNRLSGLGSKSYLCMQVMPKKNICESRKPNHMTTFSPSREGRKCGHVICGCYYLYYLGFGYCIVQNNWMGPPNPNDGWVGAWPCPGFA